MKYYVYQHVDPETEEILYIGKGCGGRAWDVTRCRTDNKDHQTWMLALCEKGYVPTDWTTIILKNISEKEALFAEKNWLHTKGAPKFNRQSGQNNYQAKLTDEQAREIYTITKTTKRKHKDIALEYGVSRAAVSMIASRKQWKAATACLTQ